MRTYSLAILWLCVCRLAGAAQPTAEIISVHRIWDQAPHSAFTDLIHWKDRFVCAFREGRAHVSTDGRIRVLTSPNGETWESAAVIALKGFDLRDAGLSVTPAGRLMLIGGAAPRKKDTDRAPTGSFVAFSNDGMIWTEPKIVVEPGRWLWRVAWHAGKAYGVTYDSVRPLPGAATELLVTSDGLKFTPLVPKLLDAGTPTEATVRFSKDGTAYCLQRRDGEPRWQSAYLGTSRPPYTKWQWHDLGIHVGGPNLLQLPSGQWIAAGRFFDGNTPKMKLASLDVERKSLEPILELPSGGDCSYPGLVWHDGMLWVSYYSSHEGKASIYLAKVKTPSSGTESEVGDLLNKPLYKFTESEVDAYLKNLAAAEPDLRKRIVHLARKNIGQPYELYLLGEMPFEPYDPQPIYCLGKSDCLVFAEHTYAMALSHNWPSFMRMLQRIRYRDGRLGVATRNHYTEADWNVSNGWLVEDITAKLAGNTAVTFKETIDRSKFLKNRYHLDVSIPIEKHEDIYLPYEQIERAKSELQDGDFVNVVRGTVKTDAPPNEIFGGSAFVGHVGLIAHGPNGEVHVIHSTEPKVREEPLDEYIQRSTKDNAAKGAAGKPRLVGFKFLRLRDDPLKNLQKIDGAEAPRVTLPSGDEAKF